MILSEPTMMGIENIIIIQMFQQPVVDKFF